MDMEPERIDPVSGNEIPLGAVAENVRDDIPAQLSEGEYVVPADVVNYYGVKFFEDLRSEAKEGFQEMAETGRIGGEPMDMPEGDDFPFDMSELEVEDGGQEYNQGGVVYAADGIYAQRGGFDMSEVPSYTAPPPAASTPSAIGSVEQSAEAMAGRDTTARPTTGRRGPIITRRLYRNPVTGQEIYLSGYTTPGKTPLSSFQRGEDGVIRAQGYEGPGYQPVDARGRPVDVPPGFEIVPISESPRMQIGPEGRQASIPHPLAGTPFGPQINRNPQSNPFRAGYDQAIYRQDEMSKYPAFGGRADYFDQVQNLSSLSDEEFFNAIDRRHGLGEFEGQATRKQGGMRTGLASGGETNRQLDELYRRQAEARAAGDYELLGTLINKQLEYEQYLVESGLDLDGNGRADTFGERTLGQLLGFGKDEESAESRQQIIDRAENADAALRNYMLTAEQKEAEIQRAADRQLSGFEQYQTMYPEEQSAAPAQAQGDTEGVPAYTPSMSLPTPDMADPVVPGITTRPTYAEMGVPTPPRPSIDEPRPGLFRGLVDTADAATVPLSAPTGTFRPAVAPTPTPSVQEQRAAVQSALAERDRIERALDEADRTDYRPMPNFPMPPSPRRSSTLLQDRAAETGYSNALNVPAQQGNPFMQRRMMNEGGLAFSRSGAITGRTPAFSAYTPGRGTNEYRAALAAQARDRVEAKRAAAAATKQGPNVMFRDAMSGQRMPGEEGLPLSEIGGNSGIVGRAEPQFVGYTAPATTPLMRDERLRGQIAAQERQAMRDSFAAQPEPLQPGVADYGTIDRYGVPAEGKPTPRSFQAPDRSAEYRTGYNDGFAAGQRAARSSSTMDAATAGMARGSVSEPTAATAAASYDPIPGAPSTAAYDPVPGLDAAMSTAMFDPIPAAPEAPQRMSMDRATGALPRTTERPSTRFGQDSYYPVQATLSREVAARRARGEDPFINVQDFYDERRAEEERRAARGLIDYLADATEGDITGKTEGTRYTSGERDAEYDRVMAESRALDAANEAYDYGTDKPEYDEETIQRLMAESEARQAAREQTDMLLQLQAALRAQETMEMNTAIEGALDTLEKQLDDQ